MLERRQPHPRKAAGAKIVQWRISETVTRNTKVELFEFDRLNERNVKASSRINWRASLVPAAAVIPAPEANIRVVAVKKLVVEFAYVVDRLYNFVKYVSTLYVFIDFLKANKRLL